MGQTMSMPETDKSTEAGGNSRFYYAVSEMQGWRMSMEDKHTIALELDEEKDNANTFFAVYDGHGGAAAARFASNSVHQRLTSDEAYKKGDYRAALKNAFLATDAEMRESPNMRGDGSGCTAVAALVTREGKLYVANAGDSRSVISIKGEVKPLSFDHKPGNETEKNRVIAAGGYVSFGRVNGNLALARALGDFDYKRNERLSPEAQIITCDPDITEHDMTDEDEFFIIACDGIWDCLGSQDVVDAVRLLVSQGKELSQVCEEICDHCLAPDTASGSGIGCDNMTIMIVAFLHGRTIDEWYKWITDRTKSKYGYATPNSLPQLYSPVKLENFRQKHAAFLERKARQAADRQASDASRSSSDEWEPWHKLPLTKYKVTPEGRLVLMPAQGGDEESLYGHGIGSAGLMFADMDEDEDDDDYDPFLHTRSESTIENPEQHDATKSLREQLDELEGVSGEEDRPMALDSPSDSSTELQGEAPPPPPHVNGDAEVHQLEFIPGGDEPSPAVKAEGLLDKSEDPTRM